MKFMIEQPEAMSQQSESSGQADAQSSSQGIGDILTKGLGASRAEAQADNPAQTEAGTTDQQLEGQSAVEKQPAQQTGFGELTIGEQKVAFNSKEEFEKFIESNPLLKEGYMKSADYTQKTQALAKEAQSIQQASAMIQQTFGSANSESIQALGESFKGYQMADDRQAQIANAFFADLTAIAKGLPPKGPLALQAAQMAEGQAAHTEQSPFFNELNTVKSELARLRYEQQERDRQAAEYAKQKEYESAVSQVQDWLSTKEKGGIKVGEDERKVMAMFAGNLDPVTGKEITLDEAYELALTRLGKTQKIATQKVFETAKDAQRKAPIAPSTRPSTARREPKTYADIFSNAV